MTVHDGHNLCIFANFNFIIALVMGLIGPIYMLLVEDIATGPTVFGLAFGTMILCQAGASYYAGDISDRIGRKRLLYIISYLSALLLISYTLIGSIYELLVLQAVAGAIMGATDTIQTSVIGDMTTEENRDKEVGKFYAKIGVASALGFVFGGYAISELDFKAVFYICAGAVAASTILLMKIR